MDRCRAVRLVVLAIVVELLLGALLPSRVAAQSLCDANADGVLSVSDGVQVLRAAAGLPSSCTVLLCDANRDGAITVGDGVNVLRAAATLPGFCDGAPTPTPTATPQGPPATAVEACDDDCRAASQVCDADVFFDEYASVEECTDDCVDIVVDFADDGNDFEGCVAAQVRFIECCTEARQCGDIPEGCGSEFDSAVTACGGSFGGCPLIFF
jgi:hypothetical protein